MKTLRVFLFSIIFFHLNAFSSGSISDHDYYYKLLEDIKTLKAVSINGARYQRLEDYKEILLLRHDYERIEAMSRALNFYYEGGESQRALFKKCRFPSAYTFAGFYKRKLSELESCIVESCSRKKALYSGVSAAAGNLKKEVDVCFSELNSIVQ